MKSKGHRPPPTMDEVNLPISPVELFYEHGDMQHYIGYWKDSPDNIKNGWIYNEQDAKKMVNILPIYVPNMFKIIKY